MIDLLDPVRTGLLTEIETIDFGNNKILKGKFKYTEDEMYGFYPTQTFTMDEQEELEKYFRECVYKEAKMLNKTEFILFLCSLSYIGAFGIFMSLLLNIPGYSYPEVFAASYILLMVPQIVSMSLREVFPMFNPKKYLDRRKYYKKLKLFIENEEEIQRVLTELNEMNMNPYEFDGNIHNIRKSDYEEIVSLTKRIKK